MNKLKSNTKLISYILVTVVFAIVQTMLLTGNITNQFKNLLVPCCCYVIAALALNLCVGLSGELSLGHAGFMGIGAYTAIVVSTILTSVVPNSIIRLVIAIICSMIISAIFGFIIGIPVLKLEGDYLAIVTLAFCQIIKGILTNVYLAMDVNGLHFSFITNKLELGENAHYIIKGPVGATGNERISSFLVGIVGIAIALTVIYHLVESKHGRAIKASKDNPIALSSIGINVTKTKMLAFIISACLAGMAGAIYGLNYSTLSISKFDFNQSILILVYVVLGGLGNFTGTIISTITLYLLPELLRGLQDYRMLIYSVILIIVMLVTNNDKVNKLLNKDYRKEKTHE